MYTLRASGTVIPGGKDKNDLDNDKTWMRVWYLFSLASIHVMSVPGWATLGNGVKVQTGHDF